MKAIKKAYGVIERDPETLQQLLAADCRNIALDSEHTPLGLPEQHSRNFSTPVAAVWVPHKKTLVKIAEEVQRYPVRYVEFHKRYSHLAEIQGYAGRVFKLEEVYQAFWDLQPRGSEHTKERAATESAHWWASEETLHEQEQAVIVANKKNRRYRR